jgi:hypothetical protein
MMKSIGAAIIVLTVMFGGLVPIAAATAAPLRAAAVHKAHTSEATDLSARRRARHRSRYAYRAYDRPYYPDRPYYYAPAPFVPFNFGYGFAPWQ